MPTGPTGLISTDFWQKVTPISAVEQTKGYVILPSYNLLGVTIYGVPYVVEQYNYQVEAPFTFHRYSYVTAPIGLVGSIVARTIDPITGITYRYNLFPVTGDGIPAPAYNGQLIYSLFTLEMWVNSLGANNAALGADLQLDTSILHYRQQLSDDDTFEETVGQLCTNLFLNPGSFTLLGYVWNPDTSAPVYMIALGAPGSEYLVLSDVVTGGQAIGSLLNTTTSTTETVIARGTSGSYYLEFNSGIASPYAAVGDEIYNNAQAINQPIALAGALGSEYVIFGTSGSGQYNLPLVFAQCAIGDII